MKQQQFKEQQLPWVELERLGLAERGQLLLTPENKEALLGGRRTALIQLHNIKDNNVHIGEIDVKLSLVPDEAGKLHLQAHPIHRYPEPPQGLEELEAMQLISGEKILIHKKIEDAILGSHEAIFEYDPETREFIKTDPLKITIPDRVNGEELTPAQRERYRKGKEVELTDGTTFRYTGVDTNPVRSNRLLLIASIFVDGGLTYLAYQGLRALAGNKNHDPKAAIKSEAYNKTYAEMEHYQKQHQNIKPDTDHDRGYTRSGRSR